MTTTRPSTDPPYLHPPYKSTVLRSPSRELVLPAYGTDSIELTSPVFGHHELGPLDHDLTRRHFAEPYFAEDAAAHTTDPLLAIVEPERRGTMIAVPEGGAHRFDVRLQGPEETVFLAH